MNVATLARAPSYAAVASVPSVCTERGDVRVVPLVVLAQRVDAPARGFCDVFALSR